MTKLHPLRFPLHPWSVGCPSCGSSRDLLFMGRRELGTDDHRVAELGAEGRYRRFSDLSAAAPEVGHAPDLARLAVDETIDASAHDTEQLPAISEETHTPSADDDTTLVRFTRRGEGICFDVWCDSCDLEHALEIRFEDGACSIGWL